MKGLQIVADENIPQVRETFGHLGEVHCYPGRQLSNDHVRGADVLLVRSVTRVDRSLLKHSRVKFVGSATIGYDHLDCDYLQQQGIHWANAPGCNADSVVDYVISAICRLEGVLGQLLAGARVGIVGMGNVGGQLYRRLSRLGIDCVGYDPLIEQSRYPILTGLETVLDADVVCVHAPLTRTGPHPSFHLLDEKRLQALRPGAVLINAGRGAVVDGAALLELLQERQDIGVVLDVWENEPEIDVELMQRADFATPHIAGYSYDGKLAGTHMIYRACCAYYNESPQATVEAPAVEEPIELRKRMDVAATVRDAVLSAYDIAADDQRLRGAILHGGSSPGEVFDRLRKEYPQRREFRCYRIKDADRLSPRAAQILEGLGFHLR